MEGRPNMNINAGMNRERTREALLGWAGVLAALGMIIHQLLLHGLTLWSLLMSRGLFSFFTLPDSQYGLVAKLVYGLALANELVMFIGPLAALILMILRKRNLPKLLAGLMAFAAFYNVAYIVLASFLPAAMKESINLNYYMSALYLVLDILLFLLFSLDKPFRRMFYR